MNKRFEELKSQCWEDVAPEWAENVHMVFNTDKFSTLIVQECTNVLKDEMNRLDCIPGRELAAQVMNTVICLIENHFGVGK